MGDLGIQPLYIDACHTQLWEMTPYVRLAKQAGYDVTFVDPVEIYPDWKDVASLEKRTGAEGRPASKVANADALEACIHHFEDLSEVGNEAEQLVLSCRPGSLRPGHEAPQETAGTKRPASEVDDGGNLGGASKVASPDTAFAHVDAPSLGAEARVASDMLRSLRRSK